MRTEIGSEFWNVPVTDERNKLFPEETLWFQSGRSALSYIIADIMHKHNVETVGMPSWCCESMIRPFAVSGLKVCFYDVFVDKMNTFVQRVDSVFDCDVILLMDYFGFCKSPDVSGYKGIVIKDITHSIFGTRSKEADYCFGSLRKWCGIKTGGFAYAKEKWSSNNIIRQVDLHYVELRKNAMVKKADYISGIHNDKEYLNIYQQAEQYLEDNSDMCILGADKTDIELAQKIDVQKVKECRRQNARVLLEELKDIVMFSELDSSDCPLFVPIIVPKRNRTELRNELIKKEIYCPVHWPLSHFHQISAVATDVYESEISLVCDQRYGVSDMERLAQEIKNYFGV